MSGRSSKGENGTESDIEAKIHPLIAKNPVITIKRSQIRLSEYNPRILSEKGKAKLSRGLDKFGLCETLCWNSRTGNLVGGHQRLHGLDKRSKGKDYLIQVTRVDLYETSERELNILLNNPEAQGDWDLEKLGALIKIDKINVENAGFDTADIFQLFGDSPIINQPEKLAALAESLQNVNDKLTKMRGKTDVRDDISYYLIVVFKDHQARKHFTEALHLPDNRFVDGRGLETLIHAE